MKYIWMVTTMDKYELPIMVAESCSELAKMAGVTTSTIFSDIFYAKKRNIRSRYKKVEVEDDDLETDKKRSIRNDAPVK